MRKLIWITGILLLATGCGINQKEVKPEDGFLKIYNHPDETLAFYPEGVTELPGGGYMFVSAVKDEASEIEYPYAYVVRTNEKGVVIWTRSYDLLAPASGMITSGNSVGFVAMDAQLNAFAVMLDPATGEVTGQTDLEMTAPFMLTRTTREIWWSSDSILFPARPGYPDLTVSSAWKEPSNCRPMRTCSCPFRGT